MFVFAVLLLVAFGVQVGWANAENIFVVIFDVIFLRVKMVMGIITINLINHLEVLVVQVVLVVVHQVHQVQ